MRFFSALVLVCVFGTTASAQGDGWYTHREFTYDGVFIKWHRKVIRPSFIQRPILNQPIQVGPVTLGPQQAGGCKCSPCKCSPCKCK